MNTVKQRLVKLLETERMSKTEFSRLMGVSTGYVNALRQSMPPEKVNKLLQIFPRLNRDWLLFGDGEMYKEDLPAARGVSNCFVPLLPVEAFAGRLQDYSNGISMRDCDIIAVPSGNADFAIQVTGDSMEPEIHTGTIVALRRINDKAFIPWGHPLVLDTENGVLVKVVNPSDEGKEYITAQSYNPRYSPMTIPMRCIYGLYRIVAYMRKVSTI